jgi:hypothetical protein
MVSYKDRTYCPYYLLCEKGDNCSRALTPDIKHSAEMANIPICQYAQMPDCFVSLWEPRETAG